MVLKGEDSKRPQAKAWCKEWGAKPQDEPGFWWGFGARNSGEVK